MVLTVRAVDSLPDLATATAERQAS
jgi:hypothetical protein